MTANNTAFTKVSGAEALRDALLPEDAAAQFRDLRPLAVVKRYLAHKGLSLATLDATGALILVRYVKRNPKIEATDPMRLLTQCKNASKRAQNTKDNYARMCAEEDEEELDMLIEACRASGLPVRKANHENRYAPINIPWSKLRTMDADSIQKFVDNGY